MFEKASDQLLKDIVTTLEGDVPILVGTWTDKIDPRVLGSSSTVEYEYKPCGCLMMDGHVEEYNTWAGNVEFKNSAQSTFLAIKYNLRVDVVKELADEFDKWAKQHDHDNSFGRIRKVTSYKGLRRTILTVEAREELLGIVREQLEMRGLVA